MTWVRQVCPILKRVRTAGIALCLIAVCVAMNGCDDDDDDGEEACIGLTSAELKKGLIPFCDDLTDVAQGEYKNVHAAFMEYVNKLQPDDAGDSRALMQPIVGTSAVYGSIFAFKGANQITQADLAKRGMVVARVNTTAAYAHGLQQSASYVVVEHRRKKGYRVLLIPEEDHLPVTVLYASHFKERGKPPVDDGKNQARQPARSQIMATLHIAKSREDWLDALSEDAKGCVQSRRTACLVNPVKLKWPTETKKAGAAGDGNYPTDFWVWVTETGCVCVGTSCHVE